MSTPSNQPAIETAADLPERLAQALSVHRPSRTSAGQFAPKLSYGRHAGPASATARAASVVMLLFQREGRWHIPLTIRPASLTRHGGQISLPGGAVDAGETSAAAALRELDEELGPRAAVELHGQMSDCYVFASDYLVTPWLAATHEEPSWRPQAEEVTDVIELPIATLLDAESVTTTSIERGPVTFHAPCYQLGQHVVWGATSVVLSQLAQLLQRTLSDR